MEICKVASFHKEAQRFLQNLPGNAVDKVKANFSIAAWRTAIGTQSAGRCVKISKRPRPSPKLYMVTKSVGIFTTTDGICIGYIT